MSDVDIKLREAYGNVVDDVLPVVTGSRISSFVEEDDDWSLCDVQLSSIAKVRASLHVDLTAI